MSDQRHEEKGPVGGEKGKNKEDLSAPVVGSGKKKEYSDNRSKHTDTDEFWSSRTSGGRGSKLFGAGGAKDNKEEKDAGTALTPNDGENSDEEMEELQNQIRQAAASPTPTDRKIQPATKKRRFSTIPGTPRRVRIPVQGPAGKRTAAAASLGDISALFSAAKDILIQGRDSEAAAIIGRMKVEEEIEAHKQGLISVFDRITTVQSDFRTALARDDALERVLATMGSAVEKGATEAANCNAMVASATAEIGWLKARVEAMEGQVAQTCLEAAATKSATLEMVRFLEKEREEEKAAGEKEKKERSEAEKRLTVSVHRAMDMMHKQMGRMEQIAYRREDKVREIVKNEHEGLVADYQLALAKLRQARDTVEKLEGEKATKRTHPIEVEDSDSEPDSESEATGGVSWTSPRLEFPTGIKRSRTDKPITIRKTSNTNFLIAYISHHVWKILFTRLFYGIVLSK